jgi:hypothetical protein
MTTRGIRAAAIASASLALSAGMLSGGPFVTAASAAATVNVSQNCAGQNAEVEEATASPGFVYQVWIGCGGIGYARSTDGGATYSPAVEMPGSGGAWDPSIAVGPTGIVYVAYMLSAGGFEYPVVSASFDQGASFTQTTALRPPASGNWGDRDFIAVGPSGEIYVTWDYGPDASKVQLLCSPTGSCAFSNGDLNAVVQKSTDGGKTFGPITPIGPNYPIMGGYSAPVLVDPAGKVDALYWGHQTDPNTYALQPGFEFFTTSTDGGTTWPSSPVELDPSVGSIALPTWWIDGDLAIDAGGTLYATWDTQTSGGDIGYLSFSTDGGTTWSTPVRVTPDTDNAMHNVQVAGGPPGTAYVAWQTSAPSQGYATYLQTFSTTAGLIGSPAQVSTAFGNPSVWPGDTFGLATLPGNQIALSWGSANGTSSTSEIYATVVSAASPGGISNGGFETGSLSGWAASGPATGVTTSGPHTGSYAAMLGSTSPTNGASSISQTFTAPAGSSTLSLWYDVTCPDTVSHDWATATLKDNTTGKTTTLLAKTCVANSGWVPISHGITAGHSYTITLTSRDDNRAGNATYTRYDDISTS